MTQRNQKILYAWLETLLTAFWQGATGALGADVAGPFIGISVPSDPWEKMKTLAIVAVSLGTLSVINILKKSPLPQFEFGVQDRLETVERHINAMTNVAIDPPKE